MNLLTHGIFNLSWIGVILATLLLTHITIASVTIFLHRSQAHRSLDLHPVASHFFRFWLWMTTAISTKEWVSVHRKHHAKCETVEDPHSPQIKGIKSVMLRGAEMYKTECKNPETTIRYGHGTPDDWLERNLYVKRRNLGVSIMLVLDVVMFGAIGITVWAIQMAWIPFWAAGVINGLGHFRGYRNFECADAATNLSPIGILVGGEELHNNHHTYPTSAKLSVKPHEFDIGWLYIRLLETVGLAKVKKVAPLTESGPTRDAPNEEMLSVINHHRFEIMAALASSIKRLAKQEAKTVSSQAKAQTDKQDAHSEGYQWLHRDDEKIPSEKSSSVEELKTRHEQIGKMIKMREELKVLWQSTNHSQEQLVEHLKKWCHEAENCGINALKQFSIKIRSTHTKQKI